MDGIFIRRRSTGWSVLLLLCGISFLALYVYLSIADRGTDRGLLSFLILGVLCSLVAIASILLNHGAYIRIEENGIKAKYHWFGRFDLTTDQIQFVWPQLNTLTILLKCGKRHVIMGVENSWALAAEIRRRCFQIENEDPQLIRQKLSQTQAIRKKDLWRSLIGTALLFMNIFITVLLTGGRDPHEFSKADWIVFSVMGLMELLTLIGLFYVAQRCGRGLLPIEHLKYRLCGAVIASHPLPTNNIIAVYTNEHNTGRIVVCGFPNDRSVYYCVQKFVGNFELETVSTSEIYESTDGLPKEALSAFIDISSCFDQCPPSS